ncbi:MAG TPA: coniferyl-alcohol dehydrogenase [Nevskiaceae bacterium]
MAPPHYLVSGGSSGIGRALVAQLLRQGARVTVLDRNRPSRDAVDYVKVDLADPESLRGAVRGLRGPYSGLANVAGVSGAAGADLTLRVNFLGLRALTLGVVDLLAPGSGIVNVASRAGHQWPLRLGQHLALADTASYEAGLEWLGLHPVADTEAYPYSKEVLRVWTQLYAAEAAARRLRVNVVNPGPVETPILKEFRQMLGEKRVDDGIQRAGRAGTPEDIAPVIAWLLSADARWINGAEIAVDGGLQASYVRVPKELQPGIPAGTR